MSSLSPPPSSPFKSGREWFICSEAPTWPWALSSSWFSQKAFTRPLPTQTKNHFMQLISPSGQTPCTLSPWTIKRWSSQENRRLAWSSNRTVLFSCVDIGRPSALSRNGKGTVWMELTWAWKTGVRKGHQPSRTRGSDRACPSQPFPLPC